MDDPKSVPTTMSPPWLTDGWRHIWLPYTQMYGASPPLPVERTEGSRLQLANGRWLVDGIASWWTAAHGYNHPHILAAMRAQLDRMPHVMFGGLAHEPAYLLAARLAELLPGDLNRCFFAESGSVSVEVALKMAMQYWLNRGRRRPKILHFRGGYHGDTLGTMAVSDPDEGMHAHFSGLLPRHLVADLPTDREKTLVLENLLDQHGQDIAAFITEPLVQGAAGMRFHGPRPLRTLRRLADQHDCLLIFDEIFTGFGRTGSLFASQQAGCTPDILTLSKALTGGVTPLSACVASDRVFDGFLSDNPDHALMHGPTYMAHPLGCAAANASLDLFARENRLRQVQRIKARLARGLAPLRNTTGVADVRLLGAIAVVELDHDRDIDRMRAQFIGEGVWVRPLGRVIYLTPALTISDGELEQLISAIKSVVTQR